MAAARNNLTRRSVLGAAFAVPAFIGASPGPAAVNRRDWDAAVALLGRAEAAEESYRAGRMRAADRAFDAVRRRWPIDYDFSGDPAARAEVQAAMAVYEPFESRVNDLHSARLDAIQHLLQIPAPDLPALAIKIALTVDCEVYELEDGEECMAALKADGLRLSQPRRHCAAREPSHAKRR
jgi:hypothetical protein